MAPAADAGLAAAVGGSPAPVDAADLAAAGDDVLDASTLEHQVVRDLHWAMASPHLLQRSAGLPLLEDDWARHLVASSGDWLRSLDADPQPLRSFLRSSPQYHRLGHYFAGLVEFWLRFCPAMRSEKVLARQEFATAEEAAEADHAGKLKFLVRAGKDALHLEAAIHWSLAKGLQEVDIIAARYSGGFLHESLCWRVLEARNRMRLAAEPAVAGSLKETLGSAPRSIFLLRGQVFYSVGWLRSRPRTLAESTARNCIGPSTTDAWSFLSPDHRVGWWTHDARELLTPESSESRWAILEYKRFWLSPAVGVEDADGRVRLHGDAALRLKPLDALDAERFQAQALACRHLLAGHPVLVAELRRSERNPYRWIEVSRGFLLPEGWAMDAPTGDSSSLSDQSVSAMEDSSSITQLQLSLERMLRAGAGLEAWWREADKLAEVAERVERRSVAAQEARLVELWQPPPPEQPLDVADGDRGLALALEQRWPQAAGDEALMADLRGAVLAHLAGLPSLAEPVVRGLAGLGESGSQRVLAHLLLDAAQKLLQKRGCALVDRPLTMDLHEAWDSVVQQALAPQGRFCPKVVAKASRTVNLPPPPAPREHVLRDLHAQLAAFGFPGEALASTQREAQLTGAVQLCGLRLRAGGWQLLGEGEARPALEWLAEAGEASAALALTGAETSAWVFARGELRRLLDARGPGKQGRRPPKAARREAARPSDLEPLPPLRLRADVSVRWVGAGLSAATEELFKTASAEGGVISLDAEWRPYSRGEARTPVELLQLATPSACWLLDLLRLAREEPGEVAALLRRLGGGECLLVGYGLGGDIQRVFESYPALPRQPVHRALDLAESGGGGGGGLRGLVRAALGRELDKGQQCSDWSRRPLAPEQEAYAALDAHVLLLLAAGCAADTEPAAVAAALRARHWDAAGPLPLPLGPADVDAAWASLGVPATPVEDVAGLPSDVLPCKTLALLWTLPSPGPGPPAGEGEPSPTLARRAVAVLPMDAQLSLPLVAAALGVPSSRLRLARHQELVPLFGYEAGALGPVGMRPPTCAVLLDRALEEAEQLAVGGGSNERVLRVPRAELCSALGAQLVPVARPAALDSSS